MARVESACTSRLSIWRHPVTTLVDSDSISADLLRLTSIQACVGPARKSQARTAEPGIGCIGRNGLRTTISVTIRGLCVDGINSRTAGAAREQTNNHKHDSHGDHWVVTTSDLQV